MLICRYIHTNVTMFIHICILCTCVHTLKMPIIPLLHYLLGTEGREDVGLI